MLTLDVLERASETAVLNGTQTSKVCRNSDAQCCPPHDFLISHILTESSEENQKRELDGPKTGVEENDHHCGSAQVGFRPLCKIGWRWEELPGRHGESRVQGVFAHLPQHGADEMDQPRQKDQCVIGIEAVKRLDPDTDPGREEDESEGNATPYNTLLSRSY